MIILKEQVEPQTLKFIPRSFVADTIVLRNETTNEIQTISAEFVVDSYYLSTSLSFDLKENTFYNLVVLKKGIPLTADNTLITADSTLFTADLTEYTDTETLIYRDRIFCTNQTIKDYTVNKNEYVANVTNNDFIIYE